MIYLFMLFPFLYRRWGRCAVYRRTPPWLCPSAIYENRRRRIKWLVSAVQMLVSDVRGNRWCYSTLEPPTSNANRRRPSETRVYAL